jgi:predicted DNA binding CopG/RHH family protein
MKTLVVPKFDSDEKEAEWWYDHKGVVEHNLSEALRNGTANRGTLQRVAPQSPAPQSIRLPFADLERAKKLSKKRKLDYETYVRTLFHQAILREEAALKKGRKKTA